MWANVSMWVCVDECICPDVCICVCASMCVFVSVGVQYVSMCVSVYVYVIVCMRVFLSGYVWI